MKINRLVVGAAAVAGLLTLTHIARAGALSPALERLATDYARAPGAVTQSVRSRAGAFANAFGPRVDPAGEVQVYIHYREGQRPADAALRLLGANRIKAALGVVQAWVPVGRLRQLAKLGGVARVGLPAYAVVRGHTAPLANATSCGSVPTNLSIDATGIAAENILALQNDGITGSNVKVGIISDGADCISSSQAAGYLPASVWIDSSLPGNGVEGTAMLEEVHAAAPGATLGFCGPNTSVDFVTCYQDFANWGANIISDDLGFPTAFFFNDPAGRSLVAGIQQFAQANPDISLVSAAGNDREDYFQSEYSASSTAPGITLTPTGYTPEPGGTTGRTYQSAMDIGGNPYEAVTYQLPSQYTAYFLLTWDDPLNGPYDDLDLYLVNSSGQIVDASTYDQTIDATYPPSSATWNEPGEYVQYTNSSSTSQQLKLVVMCYVCNQTQHLLVKLGGTMDGGGSFATTADGGLYGHAAMAEEISAAAARSTDNRGTSAVLESFSDTGPYIGGDWQSGTTSVPKPDITGIDGVQVSGAGGFGTPFYGTSAASPNVASVIALLRSGFPSTNYTAAQWRKLITDNANLAKLGSPPSSEGGAGLVDAQASAAALDSPITATITAPSGNPVQTPANTDVQFGASCSYSGSNQLSYQWTFGGNSGIPNSASLNPAPVQYTAGGIYTVTFTCKDSLQARSDQRTVEVDAAATAENQSLTTKKNLAVSGQLTGQNVGGEQVNYNVTSQPAHGTLSAQGTQFTYTPNAGFVGTDSFQYQIDNGVQVSNTGTVSIEVQGPTSSGGGGGGFGLGGLAALLGLAGLALVRRRR